MANVTVYWKDGSQMVIPDFDMSYWQSQGWNTTKPSTTTINNSPTPTTTQASNSNSSTTIDPNQYSKIKISNGEEIIAANSDLDYWKSKGATVITPNVDKNGNAVSTSSSSDNSGVNSLYQKYFGRDAFPEEVTAWIGKLPALETQLQNDYKTNNNGNAYNGIPLTISNNDFINQIISLDPYLKEYFQDPKNKTSFESLDPSQQTYMLQIIGAKQKLIESGKIVNPDVTLEPSKMAEFLDTAKGMIDPYYTEQIGNFGNDLKTSLQRQQEDYDKSIGRAETTFKENLGTQAEGEAQAGLTYGSERGTRLNRTISNQNNALTDAATTNARSIQDLGTTAEKKIGSSALNSLGLSYNTPTFQASESGFSNTGTRSLFTPNGTLTGELPTQRTVDELNKQTQLAQTENDRRTSEYNFKMNSLNA